MLWITLLSSAPLLLFSRLLTLPLPPGLTLFLSLSHWALVFSWAIRQTQSVQSILRFLLPPSVLILIWVYCFLHLQDWCYRQHCHWQSECEFLDHDEAGKSRADSSGLFASNSFWTVLDASWTQRLWKIYPLEGTPKFTIPKLLFLYWVVLLLVYFEFVRLLMFIKQCQELCRSWLVFWVPRMELCTWSGQRVLFSKIQTTRCVLCPFLML